MVIFPRPHEQRGGIVWPPEIALFYIGRNIIVPIVLRGLSPEAARVYENVHTESTGGICENRQNVQ